MIDEEEQDNKKNKTKEEGKKNKKNKKKDQINIKKGRKKSKTLVVFLPRIQRRL